MATTALGLMEEIEDEIEKETKEDIKKYYKGVRDNTPVLTRTLQHNWNLAVEEVDDSAVERPSSNEPNFYAKPATPEIEVSVIGKTVNISNNTWYVNVVDEGREVNTDPDNAGFVQAGLNAAEKRMRQG